MVELEEFRNRREHLKRILRERYDTQRELEKDLKKSQSFINGLLRAKRPFGEKVARSIEARLGLPRRSMDAPPDHLTPAPTPPARGPVWPFKSVERRKFEALPERLQGEIEGYMKRAVDDSDKERVDRVSARKRRAG